MLGNQGFTTAGAVNENGDVGILPGRDKSFGLGVNSNGKIIGYSRDHGFTEPLDAQLYDVSTQTLSTLTFPVAPVDINNNDQIAGGTFIGDLHGNWTDIGIPDTASSASIVELTDGGDAVAGIGMPYTDGAGRFVKGTARYTGTWQILWNNSAFDSANGINEQGDVVGLLGAGGSVEPVIYYDTLGGLMYLEPLVTAEDALYLDFVSGINSPGHVVTSFPTAILTPLGRMIIPGDVNGDAEVLPDDMCAWLADPIDLDGDGADTVTGRIDYTPPQRLFENSTFSDSLLITDSGTIADVGFTIHDNFRIGETVVQLSHAGVTVTLIDRPGFPEHPMGFSNLGYDIVLDDEGAGGTIDTVGFASGVDEQMFRRLRTNLTTR